MDNVGTPTHSIHSMPGMLPVTGPCTTLCGCGLRKSIGFTALRRAGASSIQPCYFANTWKALVSLEALAQVGMLATNQAGDLVLMAKLLAVKSLMLMPNGIRFGARNAAWHLKRGLAV